MIAIRGSYTKGHITLTCTDTQIQRPTQTH